MDKILHSFNTYTHWCKRRALPFWACRGRDPNGGGYERLRMDGTPDTDVLKRVRVQARQAYVYAHAGTLGWYAHAKSASDHYWQYVVGPGFAGGPPDTVSCAHLLNPDGSLNDPLRDTYAQSFVILAGAWRYTAFKDKASLHIAEQVLGFLDTHVKAGNGGWLEGLPATLPRRQNPHMHMFEALLALYNATKNPVYLTKLDEIFQLFTTHFYDEKNNTLREFFHQDWACARNNGGPIEPGHMMEWCWLLHKYQMCTDTDVSQPARQLYHTAVTLGLYKDLGLLCDSVHHNKKSKTLRSWPQTEFIKASLVLSGTTGDLSYARRAATVVDQLTARYLNVPKQGGWADTIDGHGHVISKHMQASTFYHLFSVAAEINTFIKTHGS